MPLYEYACDACGHRFEAIQKFSDPPLDTCPKCGGHVHKLIAAPAFQFKGSGWYVTDYGKKNSPGGGKSGESKSTSDAPASDKKDTAKESSASKTDSSTTATKAGTTPTKD